MSQYVFRFYPESRHADGAIKRRTSKSHALVNGNGPPIRIALTGGEAHDNRLTAKLLSRLNSGATLLAERGYDADWIRALAGQHGA